MICVNCRKEMTCVKTGMIAIWNGSHCYSGDNYKCSNCLNRILITSSFPFHKEENAVNFCKESNIEYLEIN